MNEDETEDRDLRLAEYQAAQNSAQHHDGLVWTVTSIIWGATFVLLGLVLDRLWAPEPTDDRIGTAIIAILGVLLLVFTWIVAAGLRSIKRRKYERCKELEKLLGFRQHADVRHGSGSQWAFYSVIMALFIFVWGAILCRACCGH